MPTSRRIALAALAVGLAAALAAVLGTADEPAAGAPGPAAAPAAAPVAPDRPASTGAAPAGRTPARPRTGTLHLRIERDDGEPAAGRVFWSGSPMAPSTPRMLAPDLGHGAPDPGVEAVRHDGAAELAVAEGAWTWLRVTGEGTPYLSAYLRVPPFHGERHERVTLSASRRAVHVFVLEADLRTPAAGREVALYARGARRALPAATDADAVATTDAGGYACFRGLAPDGYLLCAPGADPTDRPPHTHAVVLMPETPLPEVPCTLVVPEHRVEVRFEVYADVDRQAGFRPGLFLRGRLAREGELHPFPAGIADGHHEVTVRLPEGLYELDGLPLGWLEIAIGGRAIAVAAGTEQRYRVSVRRETTLTEVGLLGLRHVDLPVRVYARRSGDVQPSDPGALFLGPHRWHHARQQVHARLERVRLVASGRTGWWISAGEVTLQGGAVEVEMAEACRVDVVWYGGDAGAMPLAAFESGGTVEMVRLQRGLVRDGGATRPALQGQLVVPRGEVEVSGWPDGTGAPAWTRRVRAEGAAVRVIVDTGS